MGWSAARTVAAPAAEPVTLEQAKEFVSIEADDNEFDLLLTAFIAAARGHTEAMTGSRLVEQTVELLADTWSDLLLLPIGPVGAVAGISYEDLGGAKQQLDPSAFELTGAGLSRGIRTAVGHSWPNDVRRATGSIRLQLIVGYDELPPQIHAALLLMVSDQFAFRESGVVGTVAAEVKSSMRVDALLANHRIWL